MLYAAEGTFDYDRVYEGICYHTADDVERGGTAGWYQNADASASVGYFVEATGDIVQIVRDRDIAFAQNVVFGGVGVTARYPLLEWFSFARHRDYDHTMLSIAVEGCSDSPMTYSQSPCSTRYFAPIDERGIGATLLIGGRQWSALVALSIYLAKRYDIGIDPERLVPHSRLATNRFDPGPGSPMAALIRATEAGARDVAPRGIDSDVLPTTAPSGEQVEDGRLLDRSAVLRIYSGPTSLDIDDSQRIRAEVHYDTEDGDKAWKAEIYNLAPSTESRIAEYRERYDLSAGYGGKVQEIARGSILAVERVWEPPNRITRLLLDNSLGTETAQEVVTIPVYPHRSYLSKIDEIARAIGATIENADQFPELREKTSWVFSGAPLDGLRELTERVGLTFTNAFGIIRLSRRAVALPTAQFPIEGVRPEEFDTFSEEGRAAFLAATRNVVRGRRQLSQQRQWFDWLQRARADATIAERVYEVNQRTGMIGQPKLTEKGIEVRLRLAPAMLPTRLIRLESRLINGEYLLYAASHVIDTWEGDFYTQVKGVPTDV